MKKTSLSALTLLVFFSCTQLSAQNLLMNGSFESNNAPESLFYIPDAESFDTLMPGIFYITGKLALRTEDGSVCSTAQDGSWFISETNIFHSGMFGFVIPGELQAGNIYTLSFSSRACIDLIGSSRRIDIGLGYDSTYWGDVIYQVYNFDTAWVEKQITFTPATNAKYLSVLLVEDDMWSYGGLQADDFYLTEISTGISDPVVNTFSIYPNPSFEKVNIRYSFTGDAALSIADSYGRIVKEEILSSDTMDHLVDISNLSAGVYFITLSNEKEKASKNLMVAK